ncbi:unnamed protein product [Schistocephalus solidus]|uniref:Inhibitor_I29 domain-containing protein n=1 Tax=Schistocephalus solidus TaxID=70667 RepID=A0A183SCX0_SCHSO|nr:unnamed protein product [Schistocephalus solidus]
MANSDTNNELTPYSRDFIWADACRKERMYVQNYEGKFGFLKGPVEKFAQDELENLVDKNRAKVEDIMPPEKKAAEPKDAIKVLPSPMPFPQTSTGQIGWRANNEYVLDRYGRYCKEKLSIQQQLKWPDEALP